MPRLGNKLWRRAGCTGGKGYLASHDEAAGLLAAVRKALFKNKLVCALTWVFCHAGYIAPKAAAGNAICGALNVYRQGPRLLRQGGGMTACPQQAGIFLWTCRSAAKTGQVCAAVSV